MASLNAYCEKHPGSLRCIAVDVLDAIIIGAGASGLAALARCKERGLRALALEKASTPGGLWKNLPDWQDLQIRAEDWTLDGIPMQGVHRQHVFNNILSFAEKHQVLPQVRCNEKVSGCKWKGDHWLIKTQRNTYQSKYIIVASGAQAVPFIPKIPRADSTVKEAHSFYFKEPEALTGKTITVVGGGASAMDLIELGLKNKAKEIHWVFRSLKWMIPTSRPKYEKSNLRELAIQQVQNVFGKSISQPLNESLKKKYRYFKIEALLPDYDFDYDCHPLIPGRPLLIKRLKEIKLHRGEIAKISGNQLQVGEERFNSDYVLYGTGYYFDFDYLGLEKLTGVHTLDKLLPCLGSLLLSLDYPNLLFLGIPTSGGLGNPWGVHAMAKTLVSHIEGKVRIPRKPITRFVNHWDILNVCASFDRHNYTPFIWRLKYLLMAKHFAKHRNQILDRN